jgi:hypothetical protein
VRPYVAQFEVGSKVEIGDSRSLGEFVHKWRFHNPLRQEQLTYAGRVVRVLSVGYYHGGDALYELEGVPGVRHDVCLRKAGTGQCEIKGQSPSW